MPTTTKFALPTPAGSGAATVPADMLALATPIDTLLGKAGAQSGKAVIAASQSPGGSSYDWLGTQDKVNVTLATDGLIFLTYEAVWNTVFSNGIIKAAIFLGTNQLQVAGYNTSSGPAVQEATADGVAGGNKDTFLTAGPGGLISASSVPSDVAYGGHVTTGQAVGIFGGADYSKRQGGICVIEAAAGTYDVGVKFRQANGSGSTVKNRRLRVWVQDF